MSNEMKTRHNDDDDNEDDSIFIDSSDFSLNRNQSFIGQEQEVKEVKELQKRAQGDTRRVRFWRVLVTSSILFTAAAVSLTTYFSLRAQEKNNFETAVGRWMQSFGKT